jgi:hypothetical protein
MRKLILATVMAATAAFGTLQAATAQAAVRVYVGAGDVAFEYGRPYYRYNHEPLYVVYDSYNRPVRYYRVVDSNTYYSTDYYRPAPEYGYRHYRRHHRHYHYNDYNGRDDYGRWHDYNYDH